MAAPSYTTDLATIHLCDASSASWTEPTGFADGAITLPEADYFIQGTGCLSKTMGTGTTAVSGAIYNTQVGLTIDSPNVFMAWLFFGAPNALATQANGGLRMFCGSGTAAFKQWYVRGSDTYPYGGWVCVPVDPNVTADNTTGSPTSTKQYFGAAACLSGANAVSKGNPFGTDAYRYGRAEARINGGESANYATFSGFAATNDNVSNRWGLIQAVQGGYLWQGLLTLGYTSAVDFRDSNKSILVADTQKVTSGFNKIEVRQATSRVDWTAISILALGTVSKGAFECIDNADINWESCSFTDMNTFVFQSNSTINQCIFRRCGQVTQGSATMDKCQFDSSPAAVSLLSNNPGAVTNSVFTSDGSNHAVEITTAGTYSLTGHTFTGYASSDGSTGNEVIYNNSGGSVTLNVSNCSGTVSYRNGSGASTTVNNTITLTLTGLVSGSDIVILDAGTTTERINVNANAGTTYNFGFSTGGYVDICVYKQGYLPYAYRSYQLPASNSTFPVSQMLDRNFNNPA